MLELTAVETLAFAAVALFFGYVLRRAAPPLAWYNVPAPVVGGLAVAAASLLARQGEVELVRLDVTLREPLMIAFFTAIGFGASFGLLAKGGPQVLLFLALSGAAAVLQNVLGMALALLMGQPVLFGVLCGSVPFAGGPATGLAFAPQFEEAGIPGASAIAVAAAMSGIVTAGLLGGPVGTLLIERHRRRPPPATPSRTPDTAAEVVESQLPAPVERVPKGEDVAAFVLLKSVGLILVAMWVGSWVSAAITAVGVTLPAYIGAMVVAAIMRNLDDATGWLGLSQRDLDELGNVALSFFLVLSLMTLELWRLAAVAAPLVVILIAQAGLAAAFCRWPLFGAMGRDYEAAVMAGGFYGFMMGTTANAMANMDALVRRYGAAPRAFLVVPMVGAFFIDFINAFLIQTCLNLLS
jgi:ESS family glutamate:Na+ symporter